MHRIAPRIDHFICVITRTCILLHYCNDDAENLKVTITGNRISIGMQSNVHRLRGKYRCTDLVHYGAASCGGTISDARQGRIFFTILGPISFYLYEIVGPYK
uniref:Uncharacterized protein n=1 Tax=Parascaris univalens TaxID=6257 RepID=A0A915AAH8_PARUN